MVAILALLIGVNYAQFDVPKEMFVFVVGPGCPPCQELKNTLIPALNKRRWVEGKDYIVTEDYDKYGVTSIPTMLYVVNGTVVKRQSGYSNSRIGDAYQFLTTKAWK